VIARSLFFALTLFLAGEGLAVAADAGDGEDVKTLEKQLNDETTALSTSDCQAACRALRSIRRAADRICALEPGPRCDAARAKANDATRRVHDACPDCSIASGTTPAPEPRREEAMTKGGSTQNAPTDAPPPTAERGAGGCRSCHAGGSREVDLGLLALGILGVLRIVRRRKHSS
jgi:hypothetical protein